MAIKVTTSPPVTPSLPIIQPPSSEDNKTLKDVVLGHVHLAPDSNLQFGAWKMEPEGNDLLFEKLVWKTSRFLHREKKSIDDNGYCLS